MFRPFHPKETSPVSREEIGRQFQKGDFHNASQQCRKAGYQLADFRSDIEIGIHKLLLSRRPGEVLSFLHKNRSVVPADIPSILRTAFEIGDYHGFLKNAHRFGIYHGLEDSIVLAIENLAKRGQSADAQAWQRKLSELAEKDDR